MPFILPALAMIGGGSALAGGLTLGTTALGAIGANQSRQAVKGQTNAIVGQQQAALDRQYALDAQTKANQQPFVNIGQSALGPLGDFLGLNGGAAQTTALGGLKDSPIYQALFNNGEQAILGNASATGGLRGGNTQASLANFGRDTMATALEAQLSKLMDTARLGSSAGANLGQLGQAGASAAGGLLGDIGAAQAGGIAGQANATQSQLSSLSGLLGKLGGGIKPTSMAGSIQGLF